MRVLVTGGTGFLGRPLVRRLLKAGHQVRVLSRDAGAAEKLMPREAMAFTWHAPDPVPPSALQGVDAVAHLMGENIGVWPWTARRKEAIRESRVDTTRCLVESLAAVEPRPRALVSASALGFYGDCGDALKREGDAPGAGFLAEVVQAWEAEIFKAEALGVRTVALRLGVVIGDGGALEKLLLPFRLGLGAVVGSGRQWMSWVHRTDVAEAFIFAMQSGAVRGPVNVCAPTPLTHREFSQGLARVLRRPLLLRVPGFAVGAVLGEMGRETLLASQRASSEKLQGYGYPFRYPGLEEALKEAMDHAKRKR